MFPAVHGVVSQIIAGDPGGGGGGSVEFIASTNSTHSGNTTTETLTVPEGAQAGDVLVAAVAAGLDNGAGISDLDGWTLLHTALNPNFDRETYAAYIVLGAEPPASYTWTFGASTNRVVVVACFRGASVVTPILDDDWNTGSATPPELTAVEGCAAVGVWRRVSTSGSLDAPPEMTELVNEYGAGNAAKITVGYETGLSAGAYTRTANATLSNLNASMVLIQP